MTRSIKHKMIALEKRVPSGIKWNDDESASRTITHTFYCLAQVPIIHESTTITYTKRHTFQFHIDTWTTKVTKTITEKDGKCFENVGSMSDLIELWDKMYEFNIPCVITRW